MTWDGDGQAAAAEGALDTWAADAMEARFVRWLRHEAGPDARHCVADAWNWDQGDEVLHWIVTRPDCDRGTALLVFWRGQAETTVRFGEDYPAPDFRQDGDSLLQAIRDRWAAGFYTRSELAYDPAADGKDLDYAALEREYGPSVLDGIPVPMRAALPGRVPRCEPQDEGIPLRFWAEESG